MILMKDGSKSVDISKGERILGEIKKLNKLFSKVDLKTKKLCILL
ncbi:hypothetical protein [Clostridium akagii]|nr:hypothetical protein [Clostridium akagii]